MNDILSPIYNTYPQNAYSNPAYIGPSQGYFPNWNEFWNMASYFMGAQQGLARPIPGGFHIPYGTDPLTGVLNDISVPYLSQSRQYVYGADEEAFSRNMTSIVNNTLATLGLNLTDQQKMTVRRAADYVARFGQSALPIAEQILNSSGMGGNASSILGGIRRGVDMIYGPGGPRTPMYSVLTSMGEYLPLEQKDALFMNMMRQMAPVNGELPGGYTYRQMASMMASAASMGYNPMNAIDTNLAREMAMDQMNELARSHANVNDPYIKQLAELSASRNFSQLAEAGTMSQALYNYARDNGEIFDAANQFSSFLDVRNRIRSIEGYENAQINTFQDLINQANSITELSNRQGVSQKNKDFFNNIVTDINKIKSSINSRNYGVNVSNALRTVEEKQREALGRQITKIGLYEDDPSLRNKFIDAMILREKLSSYKDVNLEFLSKDAVDAKGNKTGQKNWEVKAAQSNEELKGLLTQYFSGGDAGLHGVYNNALNNLQGNDAKQMVKFLEELNMAKTSEQRQEVMKKYSTISKNMQSDLEFINQADQATQPYGRLLRAASNLQLALRNSGTPLEGEQLMQFINKITYGGLSGMSDANLNATIEEIGAAMLSSGASGNDVMQLAGRGAEAALAVGGNAQQGALNAMRMGLAAREAALANHKIDPNRAQEIAGLASARSNHSLVEKTYNALAAFMDKEGVNIGKSKYRSLLEKIQNNESLTLGELDTLYRESSQIMSSIGMTADQQHYYLNDSYSGDSAVAANRAGTSWMLNSTISRDIMKDNITRRLGSETKLSESNRRKIADFMAMNLGSLVENMESLTDKKNAGDLKKRLLGMVPDELKPIVEKMDPIAIQRSLQHATHVAARRNGMSDNDFITGVRSQAETQENQEKNQRLGALRRLMPDINKDMFQNISNALINGNMSDVMRAMVSSVTTSSLDEDEQKRLFHVAAVSTILDKKHEGEAGLNKQETEAAKNALGKLYGVVKNDPEKMKLIHQYLQNKDSIKSEEDLKYIQKVFAKANVSEKMLREKISKAEKNIQDKFKNQLHTIEVTMTDEPLEKVLPGFQLPDANEEKVQAQQAPATTGTSEKTEEESADTEGEDKPAGKGGKKRDGLSQETALLVEVINKTPIPMQPAGVS